MNGGYPIPKGDYIGILDMITENTGEHLLGFQNGKSILKNLNRLFGAQKFR